jgi:hypothetical protein
MEDEIWDDCSEDYIEDQHAMDDETTAEEANPADFMSLAETLQLRHQREMRELVDRYGDDAFVKMSPIEQARLTGDTSRLTPEERERYWEQHIESRYR